VISGGIAVGTTIEPDKPLQIYPLMSETIASYPNGINGAVN
jgi:hypothetical protein